MSIKSLIGLFSIILVVNSIKFTYHLDAYNNECFHESAQKGTRYSISIKSSSPLYSLKVNQQIQVHTDDRKSQNYKQFSAYASTDQGIMFCLQNFQDKLIQIDVQFYHGFYLEDPIDLKGANQFFDMTKRMQGVTEIIRMNYQKYKQQILQRSPIYDRIYAYASFSIFLFLILVAIVKVSYFQKIVKHMKMRKIL